MRTLGIDYGDSRVGIAVTDALGITAQGLETITHNGNDKILLRRLDEILEKCYFEWISFKDEEYLIECIEGICIALGSYPLNIDGNPSISENWREHILESRKLKNY